MKNIVIDGERLGKTLRKTHAKVATQPHDTDMIVFVGNIKGKEKIYRVTKIDKNRFSVRDASPEGNFGRFTIPIKEEKTSPNQIILTKEDEAKAVEYLKNLIIQNERVGKTLKKIGEWNADSVNSSKRMRYSAKIRGVDYEFDIFRSPRRGGLIIVSRPDYKQYIVSQSPD